MRLASQAGRRIVGARGAAGRRRPQVLGVGVGVPSGPPRVTKAREVHCAPFGHTAPPPPIRGGRDRFRLKEIAAQQVCWRRLPRLPAPLLPPPPTGILTRASRRGRQSRETRDSRPRQASCEQASAPQVGGSASRPPSSLTARSRARAPWLSPPFSPPSPVTHERI
ncbi:uncharacterized protein LOC121824298 isoform X1 [Peromyscus maniculatus bairdii]|uniref:uncharacterized protein LOC121824298 isoform X1 n=1 Tax=Peromyscus maniculatus bairdii TaxID=230844 RepID=UPI003FD3D27B